MKKEDVQERSVAGEEEGGKLVTGAHESKLQISLLWNCTRSSSVPSEHWDPVTGGTWHSSHTRFSHVSAQSILGPPWADRGPSNWVSPEGANQGSTPQKSGSGETEKEDEGAMARQVYAEHKLPWGPQCCLCTRNKSCPRAQKTSHVPLTSGSLGTLADLSRYKVT